MVIKNNKQIIDKWKTFAKKVFLISFPNWAKYGAKDTALIDPVLNNLLARYSNCTSTAMHMCILGRPKVFRLGHSPV